MFISWQKSKIQQKNIYFKDFTLPKPQPNTSKSAGQIPTFSQAVRTPGVVQDKSLDLLARNPMGMALRSGSSTKNVWFFWWGSWAETWQQHIEHLILQHTNTRYLWLNPYIANWIYWFYHTNLSCEFLRYRSLSSRILKGTGCWKTPILQYDCETRHLMIWISTFGLH